MNPGSLEKFLEDNIKTIGTSACPPYHLAVVVGGLSAELTLKTVKLASTKYYDDLPTTGDETGRAFRDIAWENHILEMTRNLGIGVSILCFALYHHHQYLTLTFLRLNLEVNILYTTSA